MTDQTRARYIMIGGFLGAGKTTAVVQLAKSLHEQGLRVGLISNDQSVGLVDTALFRAAGFPTQEIAGGCFCCRFNSLVDAANNLTEDAKPDVFIAEPVGSCTDLIASVSYPLRRIYGDQFSIAPLSVLVDPIRAMRILGLDDSKSFTKKVTYIYLKQLEEAELIVINKVDLVDPDQLSRLREALAERFPTASILAISARNGDGLQDWFSCVTAGEQSAHATMPMDYQVYAEGEALLGWLNATINVQHDEPFDGNEFIRELADDLSQRLIERDAEIAHLKMTLSPDGGMQDIASLSMVRSDVVPELTLRLADDAQSGQLLVNIRAEAAPEVLRVALDQTLAAIAEPTLTLAHVEQFRPAPPKPTHRDSGAEVTA